jgi:hypothetical protein
MTDLITELTFERLRDLVQEAGYRAEIVTDVNTKASIVRSAANGIVFDLHPGNGGGGGRFVDLILLAGLKVEGALPLEVVNRWNVQRRFARLYLNDATLLLALDVSVFGGVAPAYLHGQLEIWSHLLAELLAYLRDESGKRASAAAASANTGPQPKAEVRPTAG